MSKSLKLIIIGSYAPSLINFRGKLIEAAVNHGVQVVAMAPDLDEETIRALNDLGAEAIPYSLQRTGMNAVADIFCLFDLYKIFRNEKPDLVLSYTIKPVIYASIAARMLGVKNIFSIVTGLGDSYMMAEGWKQKVVSLFALTLYKFSVAINKRVFFQNLDDRDFFENKGVIPRAKSIIINGSGIDLDYFYVVELPSSPRFLMIARLLKQKGVYEYVEAARIIKKQYPDVQFDLAGWVDEAPTLTAVRQQELNEWIEEGVINYLGMLSDVRPAIEKCSVYVLPSYREGKPRTVLEAMAMGRAILTTDVPGCRDTVENGKNGYLVASKSSSALAQRMDWFIGCNDVNKMGLCSRQIAEKKYNVLEVNKVILKGLGVLHD